MKFNGIAALLAQLLLLLLVPFVALAVAFSVRANRELEQHARAEVQSFSAVAAARVEDQLQSADAILRSVALVASSWRETTADLDRTLRTLASDLPFFSQDISVFDTLGDVVATSLERAPAVQRLNVADRDYFRTALQSPHLVVGRAAVGRATGVWSLPLAHRILRDGKVVGVVVATPRLRNIGAYLSTNAPPSESMITIVDSGGVVLARNHDPDQWVGTSIRALRHVSTILRSRDSSSALEPAFDGTVGYLGWTRVRRAPWVVMIGIEEASDARALRTQQRWTLFMLALVLMAVLGFAWRLGRRVALPMQHLATVASHLGTGNLGTRARVSGVDEMRELAVAFNTMADALERQTRLLQDSNQELATLVAASPMAIITLDNVGRVRSWNPAAQRVFGWTAGEVLASTLPGNLEPLLTAAPDGVHRIKRRDGTSIALIASRAALGAPELTAGSIIVAEDVTVQQNTEEKLRHSQRVDAVGRLASGVAHDFNNLLAVMTAGITLLQEDLPPDCDLHEELAVLDAATQQGAALTRQLLSFTRQGPSRPEVFDVRRVVEATERMLRRLVPSNTALTIRVADEPLHVLMDPGQLEQVLVNLTLNARDALPEGGRIEVSALRIVAAGTTQPTVELRISDDGVGMDETTRHRVFEPFFTTKPEGRGTGLGLAVVRDIVVNAGGQVTLDSVLGRGTTVRVLLPLVQSEPPSKAAEVTDPSSGRGRLVLVVEDDTAVRRSIRRMLERHGYRVLEADNGAAALELRAAHPAIECIVSDLMMPRLDGLAMAERLRDQGDCIAILIQTGSLDSEREVRLRAVEGLSVVAKPMTWQVLKQFLQQHAFRQA